MGSKSEYNVLLASDGVPLRPQGLNDLKHTLHVSANIQTSAIVDTMIVELEMIVSRSGLNFKGIHNRRFTTM